LPGDRPLSDRVVRIAANKISDLAEVRVLSTAFFSLPKFRKLKRERFPVGEIQDPDGQTNNGAGR
jgi:hypothetical protein